MHLVGFTIRIYHDARSRERQMLVFVIECIGVYWTLHMKAVFLM